MIKRILLLALLASTLVAQDGDIYPMSVNSTWIYESGNKLITNRVVDVKKNRQ